MANPSDEKKKKERKGSRSENWSNETRTLKLGLNFSGGLREGVVFLVAPFQKPPSSYSYLVFSLLMPVRVFFHSIPHIVVIVSLIDTFRSFYLFF